MESPHRSRGSDRPAEGVAGPLTLGELWQLANRARHVDAATVRTACLLLAVFYVVTWLLRLTPHPAMGWLRLSVLAYAAIGVIWAHRFSWAGLRAYTVVLAIWLPASTAAIEILRGNHPADLALTALAVFAPVVFLQTAADVATVFAVLAVAIAALVTAAPPVGLPPMVAGMVLGGALVCGAAAAVILIVFRGRISDSTRWWQEACARERALREFIEIAAPQLGEPVLVRELASRFRAAAGFAACAIVLVDSDQGGPRVAAHVGGTQSDAVAPQAPALAALVDAVASRQPAVHQLTARDVSERFAGVPDLVPGGTLVLLPLTGESGVSGVVALSSPARREVAEEDLLLWRAMANQASAALAAARVFSRLQQALRVRSEFMNTLSHELRSPLHVILGYADALLEGKQDPQLAARRVRAGALELLQLAENSLAAAQLGAGKLRVQPSEFAMADLVEDLRESVAALPQSEGHVALRWEVAPQLPAVRLDRLKVKEIMQNLIANALKFTAEGAVTVRIGRDGEQLRIEVEDTGPGIPPEAHARVFEMFERVDDGASPRAPGVGLGLYIVKTLVQLMGGTVSLVSAPGQGSRFTVSLPLRAATA